MTRFYERYKDLFENKYPPHWCKWHDEFWEENETAIIPRRKIKFKIFNNFPERWRHPDLKYHSVNPGTIKDIIHQEYIEDEGNHNSKISNIAIYIWFLWEK